MIYPRTKVFLRRKEVTSMLVRGFSPGEIAEYLSVSRDTVYNDIRYIRSAQNEELASLSRSQVISQLHLNKREQTRELWKIVENAQSKYVKLMALKELRIHDHMVLKKLDTMTAGLRGRDEIWKRFFQHYETLQKDIERHEKESEREPGPNGLSVKTRPNPLVSKEVILQMGDNESGSNANAGTLRDVHHDET